MRHITIDPDTLRKAASEALTRPDNYGNWDPDVQYATHGCVMTWAERGDDILAESNYLSMMRELEGVIAHTDGDPDDVLDRTASHWLVDSLRELFVRVYLPGWTAERVARVAERAPSDVVRLYTPAFCRAVELATGLVDYPIIDESDYSDREYEAWMGVVDDALDTAARDYPEDSDAECQAFYYLVTQSEDLIDRFGYGPDEVRWDDVSEVYKHVRDEHFEWLARWHTEPSDQGTLF